MMNRTGEILCSTTWTYKPKCGLCGKPILKGYTKVMYGKWGLCHKSCVEQYEAD